MDYDLGRLFSRTRWEPESTLGGPFIFFESLLCPHIDVHQAVEKMLGPENFVLFQAFQKKVLEHIGMCSSKANEKKLSKDELAAIIYYTIDARHFQGKRVNRSLY